MNHNRKFESAEFQGEVVKRKLDGIKFGPTVKDGELDDWRIEGWTLGAIPGGVVLDMHWYGLWPDGRWFIKQNVQATYTGTFWGGCSLIFKEGHICLGSMNQDCFRGCESSIDDKRLFAWSGVLAASQTQEFKREGHCDYIVTNWDSIRDSEKILLVPKFAYQSP